MDRWMFEGCVQDQLVQMRMQLAQIIAANQLLERYASDEKAEAYLSSVNQCVCRMQRLVGRLELAQRLTDEDEVRLQVTAMDITQWAQELGRHLAGVLSGANVHFSFEVAPGLFGAADQGLLAQLVLELISNAAKTGSAVHLEIQGMTQAIRITVSDQGPGLDGETLSQIFQQPPQAGRGMGVVLAQQIAQLHGGLLMAESAPGKGVRMVALIPLRHQRNGRSLATPVPQWGNGGLDPILVGLSDVLPSTAFTPQMLG